MDFKTILQQISQLYSKLSLRQRIVSAASIVIVVGFLVGLSLFKTGSKGEFDGYVVLFENISANDSNAIIEQLNKDGVEYKLANEGTILVPKADVYKERIAVASLGIPKDSKVGFEIFDKQDFGSTDAEQRVKYQRALEGELARTIQSLEPINRAVVKIAIPKESVFTERQAPPTASVVLSIKQGMSLSQKQIFGIKNLVAGAVANLSLNNVKIVNSEGVALGDEEAGFDSDVIAAQMRYKREFENSYEQKIINVLAPIVGGYDRVVAKVNIDFDFDKKDTKSEVYDPNNVIRSESNIEEKRQGRGANDIGGVPGAVSNIGPVQGLDDGGLKEQYSKSSQQTNYEISKKITNIKGQFATINRVSAAVVVDGSYKKSTDENGNEIMEFVPLSEAQKASITNLIKQAIGYNATRGDEVSVDNFEFKLSKDESPSKKVVGFMQAYVEPFLPLLKYIFAALLLYLFYKKVIVVFMHKMMEDIKEDDNMPEYEEFEDLGDAEDTIEKARAARKKMEEQLGLDGDFNEDELRYDVLLEKMRKQVLEQPEDFSGLLQDLIKNDSEFNIRKEM
ncbi:flagellar basal-body MS-ring/collar protein FliF [Campylobacter sp. 19-13652]|uniref:flagellar basal-body MS-ring/collar protein FliF n=1 Tax=Campylobacter sp. 19-13652 TaxID=2840180 RepID=UPI001C741C1D|nr:flagellar basal-body MS-ring/collar protein FliF [Campylobacter sp. 19-13652]BCX78819.1 flagellar M-ring protein [Campylobacter sp. 19-13652]